MYKIKFNKHLVPHWTQTTSSYSTRFSEYTFYYLIISNQGYYKVNKINETVKI